MPLVVPPELGGKLLRAREHADALDAILFYHGKEPHVRRKLEDLLVYLHHYGCITDSSKENWTYDPGLGEVVMSPDYGEYNFYLFFRHITRDGEMQTFMDGGLCFHGPEEITPLLYAGEEDISSHVGWTVNT